MTTRQFDTTGRTTAGRAPAPVQASAAPCGHVQRKAEIRGGGATAAGPAGGRLEGDSRREIEAARGGGRRLSPGVAEAMGRRLGADLGRVRVHTDDRADRLAESLNAQAFTTGTDVFFRRGGYAPSTSGGRRLLAHELTHVVQQSHGHVGPHGSVGAAGDAHERQADRVAGGLAAPEPSRAAASSGGGGPVQRTATFVNGTKLEDWRAARLALKKFAVQMPPDWADPKMGINGDKLKARMSEIVNDPFDHGTFDLGKEEDVKRLAALLVQQPQGAALGNVQQPLPQQQPVPVPAQGPGAGRFSAEYLNSSNKAEVRKALREWVQYAEARVDLMRKTYMNMSGEVSKRRREGAYYPDDADPGKYADAVDFRKTYKDAKNRSIHMSGALNEAKSVQKALGGSQPIGVLRDPTGKIQSVVELMILTDKVYLSNLAANPENIDSASPVRKVGEASLVFTVLHAKKENKNAIELWALNNKVKAIYDHLGFRVDDGGVLVPHTRGMKTAGPPPRGPVKDRWHAQGSMVLDQTGAAGLLGRGRALLDVLPAELRNVQ
ncbi:eCIS core domain-containing protein [Sphaerisporangium corydalis]|uniref:DUF4157 domain-containing protein n=1 Tax=Sphaerisporangium corydalis TaxID=1441875 RepID=A0ABV9E9I5_9ACTN|nr:DUF4157 domain-containing protein [Sphaerisporangium corydalis]